MLLLLGACSKDAIEADYPRIPELERAAERGKLTGDGLTVFGGRDDNASGGGASPIGVNALLWRATLDTIAFLPISSADPFGGVILTDWYEDPTSKGERFKLNILILDRKLRADTLKVSVFKQQQAQAGQWKDVAASPDTARQIEDTILTRARELKVQQSVK